MNKLADFMVKKKPLLGTRFGVQSFRPIQNDRKTPEADKRNSWDNREGLVLWLTDNGKGVSVWQDSSGAGNDGTVYGAGTPPPATPGALGYYFDGVDDYILDTNHPSLAMTTNFTLSAWICPVSVTAGDILSKYTSASKSYCLYISGGKLKCVVSFDGSTVSTIQSIATIPTNIYSHAVATFGGNVLNLYANGGMGAVSVGAVGTLFPSTASFEIGRNRLAGPYSGGINDVRVYNRALSAEEISIYYNHTKVKYGY